MAERIVICEDDEDLAFVLREALIRTQYDVDVAPTAGALLERLRGATYDLVLLDVKLPDMDGLDALPKCARAGPRDPDHRDDRARHAADGDGRDHARRVRLLHQAAQDGRVPGGGGARAGPSPAPAAGQGAPRRAAHGFEEIIGQCEPLKRVLDMAQRVAPTDLTILIQGESGTGKEVLAQAIHRLSLRKDGPLVPVNAAAIPEGLLESELFGHERGAFTGAIRARRGPLRARARGTLFLDEIGDMPLSMQVKILRALQERQIERVGGVKSIGVDVRIVAATHQNLEKMVAEGRFRQDLFYRLQGVTLRLPPLRERVDDLPTLVTSLLERAAQRLSRTAATVTPEAMRCLWTYQWPGNVRELQHTLEAAMVLSDGVIMPEHLPLAVQCSGAPSPQAVDPIMKLAGGSLDDMLEESERRMILDALGKAGGVQARAAKILGISERSLWYRVKKLKIPTRPGEEESLP